MGVRKMERFFLANVLAHFSFIWLWSRWYGVAGLKESDVCGAIMEFSQFEYVVNEQRCDYIDLKKVSSRPVQTPIEHSTMGKYHCSDYSCASCCTGEINQAVYKEPLQNLEWWNFNRCSDRNCNGEINNECQAMIQDLVSEIRCSPNLYPFRAGFGKPIPDGFDLSVLEQVPICRSWCDGLFQACQNTFACIDIPQQIRELLNESDPNNNQNVDQTCQAGNTYSYDEIFSSRIQDLLNDGMECGNVNNTNYRCKDFTTYFSSGKEMCETFFPEQLMGEIFPINLIKVEGPGGCITPGEPDESAAILQVKLEEKGYSEVEYRDFLFTCHSCEWWFWWHIFLIILGIILFIGVVGGAIMFFTKRTKSVKVKNNKKERTEAIENQSYDMQDNYS